MEQLLKITTIPVAIELKIKNAKLEYSSNNVQLAISRNEGGLSIKSSPIKVNIDTFEARNSVVPTAMRSIEQYAQQGKNAAYNATAQMASQGRLFLNAKIGEDVVGQIAAQSTPTTSADVGIKFLPSTGPDITWNDPNVTIKYQMDKLNFDFKVDNGDFNFIPGDIELIVTQHPDVRIEYVGSPIYVPPSADPNHTPIDTTA